MTTERELGSREEFGVLVKSVEGDSEMGRFVCACEDCRKNQK